MSKNLRGSVKGKYWFGSKDAQEAKKVFDQDRRGDEESGPVISCDVFAEISELSELPACAGDSEAPLRAPGDFVSRPSAMRNRKGKAKRRQD